MEYSEADRKLSEGIDILLARCEGVDLKKLSEEELTLLEMKNMEFRRHLIKHIKDMVEARKVSEMMQESLFDVKYRVSGAVGSEEFTTSLERLLPSDK